MNKTEHLLTCLAEECGEVTQVASKANRFGLGHIWPEKGKTNRRILERELADILGIAEELGLVIRRRDISAKRKKLQKMMSISIGLGRLEVHCKVGPWCAAHVCSCPCRGCKSNGSRIGES